MTEKKSFDLLELHSMNTTMLEHINRLMASKQSSNPSLHKGHPTQTR